MASTLENMHSKEKMCNRNLFKDIVPVQDNVEKMHEASLPDINGIQNDNESEKANNSMKYQPDIHSNTEKLNILKSILNELAKIQIKDSRPTTDSEMPQTEPTVVKKSITTLDNVTNKPVEKLVSINKSVSKRHKRKKSVHVVSRIRQSKLHKKSMLVLDIDSTFEELANTQSAISETKRLKETLLKKEDHPHLATEIAKNQSVKMSTTHKNINKLKKTRHFKKPRIKRSLIKCKSPIARHRHSAIKPIPALSNDKEKQEIKEFIKTDSNMEWELIQDWMIAEENYLNTCQLKNQENKKESGNKKHHTKELLGEESYEKRRMLFKNIWESVSQEDTAQSDIANKPKVLKTLREDKGEKPKPFYEHKKKQKIKTLRTICKNIMDYCDQQEEDKTFYEQISATQESYEPKEEVITKKKKKKRKKIRTCTSTESEKKIQSILCKARKKALRFSKTHHTSACTKALLGSIISYDGKDTPEKPTIVASNNSLPKIVDKKKSLMAMYSTRPRTVPLDYLHHSLKATKACTEIGRFREALNIPKMMINYPLSYKFKSNECST